MEVTTVVIFGLLGLGSLLVIFTVMEVLARKDHVGPERDTRILAAWICAVLAAWCFGLALWLGVR